MQINKIDVSFLLMKNLKKFILLLYSLYLISLFMSNANIIIIQTNKAFIN